MVVYARHARIENGGQTIFWASEILNILENNMEKTIWKGKKENK
jgi:hypothetical protein